MSMFSGCGGLDLGMIKAGFRVVWANDVHPDACATYRANIGKIVEGDIDKADMPDIEDLDVLTAGFPCQPFSNAGRRQGIDDHRGGLVDYCMAYIKALRPKLVLFENVRGFLSIKGESKRFCEEVMDSLTAAGYAVCVNLVNAAHYGVPQNRLRVFIVGVRKGTPLAMYPFPKKTEAMDLTLESILDVPEDAANQQDIVRLNPQALEIGSMVPEGGSWKSIPYEKLPPRLQRIRDDMRKYRWPNFYRRFHRTEIAGTITAAFKPENAGVWHPYKDRVFSAREIARIQSFPDDFVFEGRTVKSIYSLIGNAVPPLLAEAFGKAFRASLSSRANPAETRAYFEVRERGKPIRPGDPWMIYGPMAREPLLETPGRTTCTSTRV